MKYLAIIPARGGSKGIPRKNINTIAGKPLIVWSIEAALQCDRITKTVVSTDDPEIADVARQSGAEVPFLRLAELAADSTPTEPVLIHMIEELRKNGEDYDAIILLQPTSPLRRAGSLSAAIARFEQEQADSLLSVCETHLFFWKNYNRPTALYDYRNRPRRQDIRPEDQWHMENGSIYITRTETLLAEKNRLAGNICLFLMSEEESHQIDTFHDIVIVERLLELSQ